MMNTTGAASCSGVTASTVPTWFSNSVTANINSTSATALTLTMTQNGQGLVTVDFPDAGTATDAGDAGTDAVVTPTIVITSPTANAYASNGTVPVQVATTGLIPSSVDLLVDGAIWTTMTSPFSFNLNAAMLPLGTHSLVASGHFGTTLYASAPVTLTIDRSQPTIVSRTPAPGTTNVHVADPIQVTFSAPMNLATLDGQGVVLTMNGAAIPFTTSLSADMKTATFSPTGPTDGGASTTLGLTLNNTVQSAAGNSLSGSIFSWSWQAPQIVTYPIPTLAPLTSAAVGTSLSVYADWQMASPSTFEFDLNGNWNDATSTALAQQAFLETGSTWSTITPPANPTPPTGMTYGGLSYYFTPTGGLGAQAFAYNTTATTGAGRYWYADATQTAGTWSAFTQYTTNWDSTYGFYILDPAGNAYSSLRTPTQTNYYKRTAGVWALWTTVPVVTGTYFQSMVSNQGVLYVARMPGTVGAPTAGNITITSYNGVGTTTLYSAPNPVNATAIQSCRMSFDPTYTPRLDCYVVTGTNPYVGTPYSFSVGASGLTMVGGGAVGPTMTSGSLSMFYGTPVTYTVDRWGRTQAQVTASSDGVSTQYYVVDLANGKWGTPILIDNTASCAANDLACSYTLALDDVSNTAFAELHGTPDSTGLKITITGQVRVINR
jgi:hypothetical protein